MLSCGTVKQEWTAIPSHQAWASWNGSLMAVMAFNSTELCPQLAQQMSSAAGGSGAGGEHKGNPLREICKAFDGQAHAHF